MGPPPQVVALHLHPVKACHRVEVPELTLGRFGWVGDREWQIATPEGRVLTQRTHPRLATIRPSPVEGGVRLAAEGHGALEVARPDRVDRESEVFLGKVQVADAGDEAARWLEGVVGEPVRLVAMAEGYRRPVIEPIDPLGVEASLVDLAPVHLVSESSHRDLAARATEPFPIDRFRPNIVVGGAPPWVEDTWRQVRIGEATLHLTTAWPRCAVPQVDQSTGDRTAEPALVMRRHRWTGEPKGLPPQVAAFAVPQAYFGMSGVVEPIGARLRVGDPVEPVTFGEAVLPAPAPLAEGRGAS